MGKENIHPVAFIIGFLFLLQCTGCTDTGTVGGGLPGNSTDIVRDTFQVSKLQTDSLDASSGKWHYLSAGQFDDPLFGKMKAIGLIKPALASYDSSRTFDQNTEMKLKLAIHRKSVYGDTTAAEKFKLIEINQIWRGHEWKIHNTVQLVAGSTVGTFTVSKEDSLMIPLSPDFVKKYIQFYENNDSTRYYNYRVHFHGLAIVPRNSDKIVTINPYNSRFIATKVKVRTDSSVQRDTVRIPPSDWAFSLKRLNTAKTAHGTTKIYNTLQNILRFRTNITDIEPTNVSKAELVLYRNKKQLEVNLPQHAVRPPSDTLRLQFAGTDELPQSIDPGNTVSLAVYNKTDSSYHFNLTGLVNNIEKADSSLYLYITPGRNDGIIRSNLLFNNQAGKAAPKIIITTINNR